MQELAPPDVHARALANLPASLTTGVVGLAVSGGSDSLALALLTAGWAPRSGVSLLVLTVDHGLRPDSRAEAEQVAAQARALGLDHRILSWTSPQSGAARARMARHALLAGAVSAAGGRLLLTGHTADDQDETFLIRARQGSGWYGLAGMRALSLSPSAEAEDIWIGRPLLGARRDTLRRWLRARGASWSDDPSNHDARHERVRMRQRLLSDPALGGRVTHIRAALENLRLIEDAALARWLAAQVTVTPAGGIEAGFAGLPAERAGRALEWVIGAVTGRRTPLRAASLRALAGRLVNGQAFRGATLGGARLSASDGKTMISRENAAFEPRHEAHASVRRLANVRALLSNRSDDFVQAAGKESFLQVTVPILSGEILSE